MIYWWMYFLIVCFQYIPNVCSWTFKKYPYADLNIKQKISSDGYPLEIHEVTTEDNYILTLFRIPHGKLATNSTNRSPVLLLHGMGGSSEMYVVLGEGRALPYNLADEGFDVWMMNSRGAEGSQGHKYYDLDHDRAYWDFGFHEIAVHDIPASIDYIVMKTNEKVFVIGHSQGNTCYFILTTEKEEYNDKIKLAVAYAPSIYLSYIDIPIAVVFSQVVEVLQALWELLGLREAFPFMNVLHLLGKRLCKEQSYFLRFCTQILSVIGSHESKLMDEDLVPVITGATLPRLSSTEFFHYMQLIKSGTFRQFDHGKNKNLRLYGNETPPDYDLNKSTAPLAIFYAARDDIVTLRGAIDTMNTLPNVVFYHEVESKHFTHIDFLFAKNASTLVYQKTAQLFKDFDTGKLSQKKERSARLARGNKYN